jgi:uncharacterized membrane protein
MTMLVLGMLLFATVHFVPSLAPGIKNDAMEKLGEGGYKGIFSLLLFAAFGLMITGWRNTDPMYVYIAPAALHKIAIAILVVAFWVMATTYRNSRLRLLVRHPQLTGVALWGISHLLLNGDSRALVLFGGMTAWSLIEIVAISKREGEWTKNEVPSWGAELVTGIIAAITIGVVVYIHPWLSGVPVSW